MALLIPSSSDLAGWAGVFFAVLVLMGCGRVLSRGVAAAETALVAGWGAACLVLTIWGAATTASLRIPASVIAVAGAGGLVAPRTRLSAGEWRGILRVLIVAVPLLAIMASAQPSLADTFLNLLPNAAYLYDHGVFPADDRWPSHSFLPGAPYNMQLAGLIAAMVTPHFPASAMIGFNILLQLAAALLLARLVERSEDDPVRSPSWRAAGLGLLLATAINPGFVPRYDFSAYSEASVTVGLALAAWAAARALERFAEARPARRDLWLLALTLAALVSIKQDSVALAAAVIVSAAVLALVPRRAGSARAAAAILAAALPAALLYGVWRWYVLDHFALGELKPLAPSEWQFALIPQILRSMLGVMAEKIYFFAAVALTAVLLVRQWRRRGLDRTTCVAALFVGVAVIYNAAIFATYIVHFPGAIGAEAHSYYRYNSHLGLLLMLALVLLGRDIAAERGFAPGPAVRRAAAAAIAAGVVLAPLALVDFLRFDLEPWQQRARWLATEARLPLASQERLALVLPGDDGLVANTVEGLLRYTAPRHGDADLASVTALAPDTLDRLAAAGYASALISCTPPSPLDLPAGQAAWLEFEDGHWRVRQHWPYPETRWLPRLTRVRKERSLCM